MAPQMAENANPAMLETADARKIAPMTTGSSPPCPEKATQIAVVTKSIDPRTRLRQARQFTVALDESADPATLSGSGCGSISIALAPTSAHSRKDAVFPALLVLRAKHRGCGIRSLLAGDEMSARIYRSQDFQLYSTNVRYRTLQVGVRTHQFRR
jgi:hypothetical protein